MGRRSDLPLAVAPTSNLDETRCEYGLMLSTRRLVYGSNLSQGQRDSCNKKANNSGTNLFRLTCKVEVSFPEVKDSSLKMAICIIM